MRLLSLAAAAAAALGSLASLAASAPLPAALAGVSGKPYQLTFLQTLLSPTVLGQDTVTALGTANFTVFAPTDAAFTALLAQLNITDPTSPALLAIAPQILLYHVSSTIVNTAYLTANKTSFVPTLLGNSSLAAIKPQVVEVVAAGSNVTLRSAYSLPSKVIDTIVADNGVIHVIDSVLIPPTNLTNTLTTLTASKAIGSTFAQIAALFVTAAQAAPEAGAIDTIAPITIFVPSDAGVTKMTAALGALATSGNLTQVIASILTYHIITPAGPYYIPPTGSVKTVGGEDLAIVTDATTGKVSVNGNDVVATVLLTNGVAHVIDTVLVPPSIAKLLGGNATVSASPSASSSTAAAAATASATGTAAARPGSAARVAGSAAGLLAALAVGVALA